MARAAARMASVTLVLFFCPRMGSIIYLGEPLEIQRGIDLGRRNRRMAQQFLYGPQIARRLQHMRCERMSQHVRVHVRRNAQ